MSEREIMTYGVPYSFVPGTKAKADEVNANFIDVLQKIEDTNTKIDTEIANTESSIAQNNEATNTLIEEINETIETKADKTEIDGNWVNKGVTLGNGFSIAAGATKTFSLSSYLPNDGALYEVIFSINCELNNGNHYVSFAAKTDKITTEIAALRLKTSTMAGFEANCFILPVGTARAVYLTAKSNITGTHYLYFTVSGYRKVS